MWTHKDTATQEPYKCTEMHKYVYKFGGSEELCRKVHRNGKKCAQILWKNEECADIRLEATIVNGTAAVAAEGETNVCGEKISMSAI